MGLIAALAIGGGQGVAAAEAPVPRDLEQWAQGPVRWLLLPAEERELRRLDDPASAATFVERFWARRDPDPTTPGNPYREAFAQRVEAADLLYEEPELRGSLTDRGR
ncbi:MAG: GWxTD domain-containing protein, partial [Thermoanaerobaculia bacterium]|nr:GWxTD domain-containing protein [Thermoanaerobaculia bacterium]